MSVGCLSTLHPMHSFSPLQRNCNCKLLLVSFQLFEWGTEKILWRTKSYRHLMEASFPSFTLHPLMKLFPSHTREGTNCGAMFSLVRATQDFCLEGLCWAQESCLPSPEKAGGECSVKRTDSLNSGRFFLSLNSSMKFNCLSEYLCSFMIKYIYIFNFNPRLPHM